MPFQAQQVPSVAGDQVVGLAGLGHGEQIIVGWVVAHVDARQRAGEFRQSADLIHHGAGGGRADKPLQPGVTCDASELIELVFAGDQREAAVAPALIQVIGRASRHNQRTDQDVVVEDDPHRDLSRGMFGPDGLDCLGDRGFDLFSGYTGVGGFRLGNSSI